MPKINQEEYKLLKEIKRNGFEEIRRNSIGDIGVRVVGDKVTSHQYQTEHNDKFKFMEPTGDYWSIAELIEEYEEDYKGSWEHAIEFSKEMRRESEETEVKKNIEWLKRSIDKRIKTIESDDITFVGSEYYDEGYIDGMRDVLYRINQLDEPEVLSQEWIEENKKDGSLHYIGYYVPIDSLHDLLVPKQELPVIPNYIAKWISVHHEQFDLYPALKRLESNALSWEDVYEWYRRNTHTFVNAYLTGKYEVEKEQKYVVELPMSKSNDNQYAIVDYSGNIWTDALPSKYKLTEEEIRGLTKGDVLFEHFAVKVEELEE